MQGTQPYPAAQHEENRTLKYSEYRNAQRKSRELGYPTDTAFSEELWRLSNDLPVPDGKLLMEVCGYVPFMGFPLTVNPEGQYPYLG